MKAPLQAVLFFLFIDQFLTLSSMVLIVALFA